MLKGNLQEKKKVSENPLMWNNLEKVNLQRNLGDYG